MIGKIKFRLHSLKISMTPYEAYWTGELNERLYKGDKFQLGSSAGLIYARLQNSSFVF